MPAFRARTPAGCEVILRGAPHWRKQVQRLRAIADEIELHRITHAEHASIDIDLHTACLTLLRQEFGIWETRAHHQQRVAGRHHFVRWLGAE